MGIRCFFGRDFSLSFFHRRVLFCARGVLCLRARVLIRIAARKNGAFWREGFCVLFAGVGRGVKGEGNVSFWRS